MGRDSSVKSHHNAFLHLAFFIGLFIFGISFAKEGQGRAVGAGGWLDDVGQESLFVRVVAISQILTATEILRLAILALLHLERVGAGVEFTFHVAAQIEVAAVSNTFQFAVLTFR